VITTIRKILELTYYSVFTLVPDKATLGKPEGAATLHSSMLSFFYFALFFWIIFLNSNIYVTTTTLVIVVVVIYGGHFIFNWIYFLKEEKQKYLEYKYGSMEKWKLRLIGISFILFCFLFFVFSLITMSILKK